MHNVALTWQQAGVLAVVLFGIAFGLSRWTAIAAQRSWPLVREAGLIAMLYAIWQLVGSLATGTHGAYDRGRWILRTERDWHLPRENTVQSWILPHPLLAQLCNLYYATMHFAALFAMLLWLFLRHRDRYPRVRATVVWLTLLCLLIQFMPVAPPRLVPQAGLVDVAVRYGQSVYGSALGAGADQLSAMPSVHVGWAVLVALVVIQSSPSRWRWLVVLHPVITVFVVVATGNHFWLDGIVAIALLVLVESGQRAFAGWQRRHSDTRVGELLDA